MAESCLSPSILAMTTWPTPQIDGESVGESNNREGVPDSQLTGTCDRGRATAGDIFVAASKSDDA